MSAITPDWRKARLTHLALEIDRGGASQVTFVVGLLHGRRGRLSQIHVGQVCAVYANTPIRKAVGQLLEWPGEVGVDRWTARLCYSCGTPMLSRSFVEALTYFVQ